MKRKNPLRPTKAINPNALETIRVIQEATNKEFHAIDDFGDLASLHILGERMTNPGSVEEIRVILDAPVTVGNIDLYRLTFESVLWLEMVEQTLEDDMLSNIATVFAMAHCRNQNAFETLTDEKSIVRAVTKWVKKVNVSIDSLEYAMMEMQPDHIEGKNKKGKPKQTEGFGPVMTLLCCELGQSPRFWLTRPVDLLDSILYDLAEIKWQPPAKKKGSVSSNPFTAYQRAFVDMHNFKCHLLQKYGYKGPANV